MNISMKKTPALFLLYTLCLLFLFRCSAQISGTEVTNERTVVYMPGGGEPAAYAQVSIVPVDHLPESTDESDERIVEVATDDQGGYSVEGLPEGEYNIMIRKDRYALYRDSVSLGLSAETRKDTLGVAGTLTGRVVLEPNHDPRTVYVQVIGTSIYYENVDPGGYFTLSGLAEGEYQLRLVTTLDNYTPTFERITISQGIRDTLAEPIEMIYTGIPVVADVRSVFDPVSRSVMISWDSIAYERFDSYLVYRENRNETNPKPELIAGVSDTGFVDSLKCLDSLSAGSVHFRYRVAVRSLSGETGETYAFSDVESMLSDQPVTLFPSDSRRFEVNRRCTLRVQPSASLGEISHYFWALGENGAFYETPDPRTTVLIDAPGDTIIDTLMCRAKVINKDGLEFTDTLILQSRLLWEKVAENPADETVAYHSAVLGDRIFVFCQTENDFQKKRWSLWSSADAASWECLEDSLPFDLTNKPLVFDNTLWVLERRDRESHAVIWQSVNGTDWESSQVAQLPNSGFSSDYEVWAALEDRIVLLDYYPLCLEDGGCRSDIPDQCWFTQNGTVWENTALKSSVFSDRLDIPNMNFSSCTLNGKLVVGGAWRSLYLTYPLSGAYSVKIWSDFDSDPEQIPFPSPMHENAIGSYNPQLIEYKGKLFLSAQINMDDSDAPDANTSYLWVLGDNGWFLCSDAFPAESSSEMKSNYHSMFVFENELYSISSSGVWKIQK